MDYHLLKNLKDFKIVVTVLTRVLDRQISNNTYVVQAQMWIDILLKSAWPVRNRT